MASTAQLRAQAVKLVSNLLLARRNGNLRREQAAHVKLATFCERHGCGLQETIDGATRELKKSIAAAMGGLV
jgi:hypothetical protein